MENSSLVHIADVVSSTIKEINAETANSENNIFVEDTITRICAKNNINETYICRVMGFEKAEQKKEKQKLFKEIKQVRVKSSDGIIKKFFENSISLYQKFLHKLKKASLYNKYSSLKKEEKIKFIEDYITKNTTAKIMEVTKSIKHVKLWDYKKATNPKIYKAEKLIELKDAKGYFISNYGRIFHGDKLMFVNYNKHTNQHMTQIKIGGKIRGYMLHRTCALYFLENPKNLPDVLFKNGNNEDCRVKNLQWGRQNCIPVWNLETEQKGETAKGFCFPKLEQKDVIEIFSASGTISEIARNYNISRACVNLIKKQKRWAWLTKRKTKKIA